MMDRAHLSAGDIADRWQTLIFDVFTSAVKVVILKSITLETTSHTVRTGTLVFKEV